MVAAPFDPALGAGYRLVRPIGAGACGQVWLATDTRTGEDVAAKLLRPEHAADHEIVARFVAERSVLTSLRHPDIVAVRDLVVEGDRVAIVMDYVPGGTLRDLLDRRTNLAPAVAVGLTALVLDALAAAHRAGVLHRDVKPDNVLLSETWERLGEGDARLTDFGIARLVEASGPRRTTGLLGTPEYMPPELIATGDCGLAGDVYAAGILLYELLAGRTPFAGTGNPFAIAQRHLTSAIPLLPVPDPLWEQLAALLDKDPDVRPSAAAAAATLHRLAGTLDGLAPLEPSATPERFDAAAHPATILRGTPLPSVPSDAALSGGDEGREAGPDLGASPHATVYRPMPRRPPARRETGPGRSTGPDAGRPPWKNPRILAFAAGGIVLLAGAVVLYLTTQPGRGASPRTAQTAITATQQDRPTPTGLTIARSATWEPSTRRATVTITYTAQKAPLTGPFLEVVPAVDTADACPSVTWDGGAPERNLPSATGITAACGWAVTPDTVPAEGSQTVTATLELALPKQDPQQALQQWLAGAGQATTTALGDTTVTSTAYPVQRLQDIQVTTPPSIVTQTALPISLVPVWPSGADTLDPLLQTTAVGSPSTMLQAVAGDTDAVRFSDGCSGALAVSADGLSVTTLTQTPSCTVDARVGNFTNLASQPFAIVNHGG